MKFPLRKLSVIWFATFAVAMLLAGCAGTLTMKLPDGTTLTSSRDTKFSGLHVEKRADGTFTIDVTNYVSEATSPMRAQNEQIKTMMDGAGAIAGMAAQGAVKGMKP